MFKVRKGSFHEKGKGGKEQLLLLLLRQSMSLGSMNLGMKL